MKKTKINRDYLGAIALLLALPLPFISLILGLVSKNDSINKNRDPYLSNIAIIVSSVVLVIGALVALAIFYLPINSNSDSGTSDVSLIDNVEISERDTERRTDVTNLSNKVEGYFIQYSKYPSLAELNSSEFRNKYLEGNNEANIEAFIAPNGDGVIISGKASLTNYSYDTTPANCENVNVKCLGFKMYTQLEGSTSLFTKSSDN